MYAEVIKKYEILTYYSKIILNMYLSLKMLSKIMNEVTYSWKMFKIILKSILTHVIKSASKSAMEDKNKKNT
jgi:predicted DNA-binding ArsR family transcriptional regulator